MASLAHFCLFFIYVFYDLKTTRSKRVCDIVSCGEIENIQFPFGLKEANRDPRCSYYPNPSFQLSCNNLGQTILSLPNSGDLVVKSIDYEEQTIQVNDPDGCLPKRFLSKTWNLSGSPFVLNSAVYEYSNLTFLSCPSNWTKSSGLPTISCLSDAPSIGNSNSSSSVIVTWSRPLGSSSPCDVISTALVPLPSVDMPMWPFWPSLNTDIGLEWTEPRCWECTVSGQVCGFANDKSDRVGCFSSPSESQGMYAFFPLFLGPAAFLFGLYSMVVLDF